MAKIIYFLTVDNKDGVNLALENQDDEITIALLQNAVYFSVKACTEIAEALKRNMKVIASKEDVELRGIEKLMQEGVSIVDYSGIIDIVFESKTVINF
jgi:sulfur relay protein TusB/DsrH